MDAISAIDGYLRDLDTERAREGYDPSTYEYYVWRKMVLEFDKQRHDAIIDKMFEEFRNLCKLIQMIYILIIWRACWKRAEQTTVVALDAGNSYWPKQLSY